MRERAFERIIGIDYSGAETPLDRLPELAVYCVEDHGLPQRVLPRLEKGESKNVKNWTREKIAHWLVEQLKDGKPTLVGIDHAFSFPKCYFDKYPPASANWDPSTNWDHFLDDFCQYWRTDKDDALVRDVKESEDEGKKRCGNSKWKRLTDQASGTAKSVFHFHVQGTVAHSTHAGIPWLRYIRRKLKKSEARVHFWPFDVWGSL